MASQRNMFVGAAVILSALALLFFFSSAQKVCNLSDMEESLQKVEFLANRVRNLTLALRHKNEETGFMKKEPLPDHPNCQNEVNQINRASVEIEALRIMLEERDREKETAEAAVDALSKQRAEIQAEVAFLKQEIERLKSTKKYAMDWSDGGKFKKFALMAIDTEDNLYNYFAPMTALLWTRVTGIRPVYMVFKYSPISPTLQLILDYSERAGAHIEYIEKPLEAGYTRGCVVMTARYIVGAWDLPEDYYVMLSDVDMWSLNHDFFHQQDPAKDVHLLFANPYGHPLTAPRYASCYVGMNITMWRTTMQVEKGDMMEELRDLLDRELTPQAPTDVQWAFDQNIFAKLLRQWPLYPDHVQFVNRDINRDRIDRSRWNVPGSLDGIVESHLLRPGFYPHHYSELRKLASMALGGNTEDLKFYDDFHSQYCSMNKCSDR